MSDEAFILQYIQHAFEMLDCFAPPFISSVRGYNFYYFVLACSQGYNMRNYDFLTDLNSEINEQQNATTKKLKTQVSYMNENNFIMHCKLYIWYRNQQKLKNA